MRSLYKERVAAVDLIDTEGLQVARRVCIKIDELCMKNDELCIENDGFNANVKATVSMSLNFLHKVKKPLQKAREKGRDVNDKKLAEVAKAEAEVKNQGADTCSGRQVRTRVPL